MVNPLQKNKKDEEPIDWKNHLYSELEKRLDEVEPILENFAYITFAGDADLFKLNPADIIANAKKLYSSIETSPRWDRLMEEAVDFTGDKTYSKIINAKFNHIIKKIVQIRNSTVREYTQSLENNSYLYNQIEHFDCLDDYENYLIGMSLRKKQGKATIVEIVNNKMQSELSRLQEILVNIMDINLESLQTIVFKKAIFEKKDIYRALEEAQSIVPALPDVPEPEPTKQSQIWDAFQAIHNLLYGPMAVHDNLITLLSNLEERFAVAISHFPQDALFNQMLHHDLDEKIPGIYALIEKVRQLSQEEEFQLCRYKIYAAIFPSYNYDPELKMRYNRLSADLPKKKINEIIQKYSHYSLPDNLNASADNAPSKPDPSTPTAI